jgi:hypothetical protein
MLDTQKQIKLIMILLPILVVGLIVGVYMKNEAQKAADVEYARIENEKREQAARDYAKSMEPTAEDIARNKRMDSLSAEIQKGAARMAMEVDRAMLETIDTTTAEGKQKWAEYKKRTSPY